MRRCSSRFAKVLTCYRGTWYSRLTSTALKHFHDVEKLLTKVSKAVHLMDFD